MTSLENAITGNVIVYQAENESVSTNVLFKDETFWMTQKDMAKLFDVNVPAISKHLKNIFESGELDLLAVISKMETTAEDGKIYQTNFYNLDAIIAVGYRVNSKKATQFRIWATRVLREYIIKGFVLDDIMLKNGRAFGQDYFKELLRRVRSIRASERRIYQQVTDIFAVCAIDYDAQSPITREFFGTIQNKFHYAITGQTAAEIIHSHADATKNHMGLTTWESGPEGRIYKKDVIIAKNYLSVEEIEQLERTVSSFFDYIERIIERHETFTMKAFIESVDKFLDFNEYQILTNKGLISMTQAQKKAVREYKAFNAQQKVISDFDKFVKEHS
ncbi:MAG: virulence RhuM family protein [Veillonella dispar]|uniref:virulence RhuM family protein n=1 Tax=Veillonella TaxID=29465 RepID=UPI0026F287C5|nr:MULTISPECIES: virulence RhuM family protein [Veillonella]MBS6382631.1 virulence RhuM family protein [Veillonella dispar]MDU2570292.1 virulence RhuM family protein [Veillonella sp.]MDU4886404.1 virulence RhuM family protein [Veillonella dispar]MDU5683183.1 virulence RhuM family protein [Veillonella sp.]MDU5736952.1 virulence RhuM family protein [Veillonella sp.]